MGWRSVLPVLPSHCLHPSAGDQPVQPRSPAAWLLAWVVCRLGCSRRQGFGGASGSNSLMGRRRGMVARPRRCPPDVPQNAAMPDTVAEPVQRARTYAMQAHLRIDHRRKVTGQPYEVHLKAVHELVRSVTDDAQTQAAAWLHDIVEDTTVTIGDLRREFGEAVAQLVGELTDVSRPGDGNRALRKEIDRRHLAAASVRAKTVKLADLIDNCRDICRHQPAFAPVYLQEMAALLEVLGDGDAALYRRAWTLCRREADRLGAVLQPAHSMAADEEASQIGLLASERVMRHFARTFCAADIAERVPSFDASLPQRGVREAMRIHGDVVAVVRQQGRGFAYLHFDELQDVDDAPQLRMFRQGQVVPTDAPLADVFEVLSRHDFCFVQQFGEVVGAVTRGDMGKPVVRMWLFGILTIVEMALTERIRRGFPHGTWRAFLTPARQAKAEQLLAERQRMGQRADLVDCLQFGDKGSILLADAGFLAAFGFANRSAAKARMQHLQSLRNNLAHAQDIVAQDWAQILLMARDVARFGV